MSVEIEERREPQGSENRPAVPERGRDAGDYRAGTAALAEMDEGEFRRRLTALVRGRARLQQIHTELMTPEIDYGIIPGTGKPTLLKAGAEKLLHFYRLSCEFIPIIQRGDGETEPWLTVVTECRAHVGDLAGPVVATGHGAAASWEKRYRRGGPEVESAYDMLNTLLKMAAKRAMVDTALRATATSGLYSQDLEDLAPAQDARRSGPEAPGARGRGRPLGKPQRALPAAPAAPPAVCGELGCGRKLDAHEIAAAGHYPVAFGGERFCKEHGRARIALWKAGKEAAGAAKEEEETDPFAAPDAAAEWGDSHGAQGQ